MDSRLEERGRTSLRPAARLLFLLRGGDRLNGIEDETTARGFHLLLVGVLSWIIVLMLVVAVPFFVVRRTTVGLAATALGALILSALLLVRNRRARPANFLFVTSVWCFAEVVAALNGGIRSFMYSLVVLTIVNAGWLLGRSSAIALSAATLLIALAEALLEYSGHPLPLYFPGNPVGLWIVLAGILLFAVGPILSILHTLRTSNAALAAELTERTRTEKEILALSARLIHAQEDERTRIARELHDDFNQQIAALSIATSNLRADIPTEQAGARAQTDRLQQKVAELAESARRLSHELHPAVLELAGVTAALQAYCSEFSSLTGVRVALEAEGSFDSLPPAVSLCVYRIVQEALRNVAKHARVTEASVQLRRSQGMLRLTIADRGVGMVPNGPGAATGLGLVSIKERARLVDGAVDIQSMPNQGTCNGEYSC